MYRGAGMPKLLKSCEPATGAELWSGSIGDPAAEVAAARAPWPEWAAHIIAYRSETLRRFANVVRSRERDFADLIARETGKPLWEAKTEVGSVMNKVEISASAYMERTPMQRLGAAPGNKIAVRHKPHGVLAVLGPYNFPAHLPNGHIVPALIAGNAVVFKPSEKTPATAGRWQPSQASTDCCLPARCAPASRFIASLPTCRTRSWRWNSAAITRSWCGTPRTSRRRRSSLSSRHFCRPASAARPRGD